MSRGPGKWQRLILDELAERDFIVVCDLLPDTAKRSEQSALNRAAHTLAESGKVELAWRNRETAFARPKANPDLSPFCSPNVLVVVRPGDTAPIQDRFGNWIPYDENNRAMRWIAEDYAKRGTSSRDDAIHI